ncbi:amidohydrolase family protein [Streptomyces sp. NBC_00237]|uniref:amidohydrolase family protein n=1 Tax=Streptomyces sp. NBC_00237 TaxID=2975687 RepID=UPI002251F7ED|nr:amidohydrolase family protein [Streptomyces sp. NBC_00237]MCX5204783.1 amidohydrolase family protein [Streptomyces sp. NBC_00237]
MTRVDVHAHYFPELYLDMLDEFRGSPDGTAGTRGGGGGSTPEEIEGRLASMDAAGIDVQLLSSPPQVPYFDDASQALGASRVANAAYSDLIRAHPTRFRALASLPLPNVLAAVDELGRSMDELGFLGASVTTTVLGRPLTDPEFVPLFDALDRRGAVLLVHPAGESGGSPLLHGAGLDWIVGHAVEESAALLQLFQAGITVRYPRIKIITVHMCGVLPFLAQRLDAKAGWYLPEGTPPVSELLRTVWHDTANPSAGALRLAQEVYGTDRLVLGTDFPFETGDGFQRHVTYLTESGLPEDDIRAIRDENAAKLLGL